MMNDRVNYYARNLIELFAQDGILDIGHQDIEAINDELNRNPQLLRFFTSSDFSNAEKKKKLQEVFHNELDESILTCFVIAHVARRRADDLGHRVLFHVLGHIQPHQR